MRVNWDKPLYFAETGMRAHYKFSRHTSKCIVNHVEAPNGMMFEFNHDTGEPIGHTFTLINHPPEQHAARERRDDARAEANQLQADDEAMRGSGLYGLF